MNYKDFTNWLKGYAQAIKDNPTKEQWGEITEKLNKLVDDDPFFRTVDIGNFLNTNDFKKGKDFPGKPPDIYF